MSRHNSHTTETVEDIGSLLEQGKELVGTVRNKAVAGVKATHKAMHENPYKAIAIAAGIGAIVGFVMARRCSGKKE